MYSISGRWDQVDAAVEPCALMQDGRKVGMAALFEPRAVAVIGATERPGSVGRTILENMLRNRAACQLENTMSIYPVNPKRTSCCELPCFKNIKSCPGLVDMAIIVTPAHTVKEVVRECGEAKVLCAIIISAGFKEIGEEGLKLELDCLDIARKHNLRLVGPNCLGVMAPHSGLNATFAATDALKGSVAFMSQSGAMCTAALDWSLKEKVGFSAFVSLGSMVDVDWSDLISYLGSDPNTKSILIYMETIGNAKNFLSAAKSVAMEKPIVVIKAGRTEAAAKAAASHTGSLAGSHGAFLAAMKRAGVMVVDSIGELFDSALFLGKQPRPRGNNLLIITNAGGPGVLSTDAAAIYGANVCKLSPTTIERLNAFLPSAWSHGNPVDILGDASAEKYAKTMEIALADENVDAALIILSPQSVTDCTGTARKVIEAFERRKAGGTCVKPTMCSWMGGSEVAEGFAMLNAYGIPCFAYPDAAARIFSKMWTLAQGLRLSCEMPPYDTPFSGPTPKAAVGILMNAQREGRELLSEAESKQVLMAYGIPIVETRVCKTEADAVAAAEAIGFPCVVKIHSETLTHKSDVGGVKLNLRTIDEVRHAWSDVRANVAAEHFHGVTVQQMLQLDAGIELIMGSTSDPQFGPLVLFGAGGCAVEVFKDTALGVPPLNATLAQQQIESTRVYHALKTASGQRFQGTDLRQLNQILCRFSEMISDLSDLMVECDINPLLATADKLVALDARIVVRPPAAAPPDLAVRPYPKSYIHPGVAAGGRTLTIRPCHPSDIELLIQFHRNIAKTDMLEVGATAARATEELLAAACADYSNSLVFTAIDETTRSILGLCRLARWPYLPTAAELKMIVREDACGVVDEPLLSRVLSVTKEEGISSVQFIAPKGDPLIALASSKKYNFKQQVYSKNPSLILCQLSI